jgi:predicted CopG family antitoxin
MAWEKALMSDTDPVLEHLTERKRELSDALAMYAGRLAEVDLLIDKITDGRSRVRRKLRVAAGDIPPGADVAP